MGNWYCKCGNRMSNGLMPTPHGYEVFTYKQCCDGDLDEQRAYADAYICPGCGRIMIFGRESNQYMLYRPEPLEDAAPHGSTFEDIDRAIDEAEAEFAQTGSSVDAKAAFKISKSFSDEAWRAYSRLSEKEDSDSVATISEIHALIEELQNNGIRELSVRNKIVGQEYQICYRVHEGVIEIISIEWIFE